MAQAPVMLKVSPAELQIIDDALRMYAWVNKSLAYPLERKHPLEGFQHIVRGNDHRTLLMKANKIRQDIGLK